MIITNILNGIGKKLGSKKQKSTYKKIGWLTEKFIKHQDDIHIKSKNFNHFVLKYKRPYEVIKTYKEIFNQQIYKFINKSEYPVIIDCGANIGISTIYFAIAYPNARVYAFEPDNTLFEILHQNIQDNKLQHVALFNEAIWIQDTHISFSNKGSEASQIDISGESETKVKAINFANFLTQFDKIDFLKIDIEGAEYEVVKHCAESLNKTENLFLEYHGTSSDTHKLIELLSIVKRAGFKVYIKMAADCLYNPFVAQTTGTPFDVQLNIFCYK